ncbi:MAG: cysteine synthase A [Rickettsiales bacterium]|nr:cysteine synthase A [Rickettsiales bacterium]
MHKKLIKDNFTDCIGNTPIIKLKIASEMSGCNIYGKCEFLNPGGSVKDRPAYQILSDAIDKNLITNGGTIVEGTAGNTGIGLTLAGNALGLKSIIVMPKTQSEEKKKMLRLCGADLRLVDALPYKNPGNYIRFSEKLSKSIRNPNGVLWANQFDNLSNQKAHYLTTGPEIYKQLSGNVNAFICSIGTGGTLSGVSKYFKEKDKNFIIGLADPYGSAMYNFFKNGELTSSGNSITEGIGQGRITKNLENIKIDESFQISDYDALDIVFKMIKEEGLILGGSSGINIMGAVKLGKLLGPGKNIVTILCDYGTKYQSKIFNKEFLHLNNLPIPEWL